jgi:hypothetical protein
MKTAKEWAEYLPLDIKLWFIEECESEGSKLNNLYDSLLECVWQEFDWANTELGYDFWSGVKELCLKYKDREADILKDLEWIDDGKVAPKKRKKSKEDKIELAVMFFNENQELEKENAEFKKRHKTLLKANQKSMERRVELGDANMKLLSENTELKARCEALEIMNNDLRKADTWQINEHAQLSRTCVDLRHELMETKKYRDDLVKKVADLKTEKENSIWSKIKNLCN